VFAKKNSCSVGWRDLLLVKICKSDLFSRWSIHGPGNLDAFLEKMVLLKKIPGKNNKFNKE
jgi:hypothetical protein